MISDRAAEGVRTVIFRSFGRLYTKSCNFLKCMKHIRKTTVFKGWSGSRHPSWRHLGPKVVPERVRTAKMTSNRAAGGVRTFIFMSLDDFIAKVVNS